VKHVGVREFRDKATGLLKDAEPIAVERHGKVVGFYIPVEERTAEGEQFEASLSRLEHVVGEITRESMSEEELSEALNLSSGHDSE
jgi:transposase